MCAMVYLFMLCGASSSAAGQSIYFHDACATGERVKVAAVGDLLFHSSLQREALVKGSDFRRLWQPVSHIFARAGRNGKDPWVCTSGPLAARCIRLALCAPLGTVSRREKE